MITYRIEARILGVAKKVVISDPTFEFDGNTFFDSAARGSDALTENLDTALWNFDRAKEHVQRQFTGCLYIRLELLEDFYNEEDDQTRVTVLKSEVIEIN